MNLNYVTKWFRDSIPYIYWSIVLLLVAICFGLSAFIGAPEFSESIIIHLEHIASQTLAQSRYQLFFFIFFNNSIKALGVILFGILFSVIPILFLIINGFIIGIVTASVVSSEGVLFLAGGILPHGVFEIPALLLTSALGWVLGIHLFQRIKKQKTTPITITLVFAGRFFIFIIVPLFLVAAFVEAFITPTILFWIIS